MSVYNLFGKTIDISDVRSIEKGTSSSSSKWWIAVLGAILLVWALYKIITQNYGTAFTVSIQAVTAIVMIVVGVISVTNNKINYWIEIGYKNGDKETVYCDTIEQMDEHHMKMRNVIDS